LFVSLGVGVGRDFICCSAGPAVGGVDRSELKGLKMGFFTVGSTNISLLDAVLGSIAATLVILSGDFLIKTFDGNVFLEMMGFMDEREKCILENMASGWNSLIFIDPCNDRYWADAVNIDDCSKSFAELV
jgi:hypothetical protein